MKIRTLLLPLTFALLIGCEDKDDNSTTTGDGVAASDTAGDVDDEGWADDGDGSGGDRCAAAAVICCLRRHPVACPPHGCGSNSRRCSSRGAAAQLAPASHSLTRTSDCAKSTSARWGSPITSAF